MNRLPTEVDQVAVYNERLKLFAGFLNAVGLGLIGFAVLRPLTEALANATLATVWWGIGGLALHAVGHYVSRTMRREVKP